MLIQNPLSCANSVLVVLKIPVLSDLIVSRTLRCREFTDACKIHRPGRPFFLYYGSSYLIYRGYCMVVRRYEIYLRVVTGPH